MGPAHTAKLFNEPDRAHFLHYSRKTSNSSYLSRSLSLPLSRQTEVSALGEFFLIPRPSYILYTYTQKQKFNLASNTAGAPRYYNDVKFRGR